MEQTFSFRYIKLCIGLVLSLVSAILPGIGQYLIMALGGIALMTAFASFGNYDYRGIKTKLIFRIARWVLAILLGTITTFQIYWYFTMPREWSNYIPYTFVVDIALISYLLMFRPSDTTTGKKILKVVGYATILIGVNALQNSHQVVKHITYTSTEINWVAISASVIVMAIGIIFLIFGGRKNHKATSRDNDTTEKIKHKCSFRKQIQKIGLSIILIGYISSSLSFMDEGDGLTACGLLFYIPIFIIIGLFYLKLIWQKTKTKGSDYLLLPILMKLRIIRSYTDTINERRELGKIILPFIIAMIICPMLTSVLYYNVWYNNHGQQECLILILLVPPIILVYSIITSLFKSWSNGNRVA